MRYPFLSAIRSFPPDEEVGRRQPQDDTALEEITFDRVLQDIQVLLGEMSFHVKSRADTEGGKMNVEAGG